MDTGGAHEIRPEVLSDMLDGIDSDGIEAVSRDEGLDPCVECADNGRILRIDIRKGNVLVTEPTCLYLRLVRVILDPAEVVEVTGGDVERAVCGICLEVSGICRSDVVDDLKDVSGTTI